MFFSFYFFFLRMRMVCVTNISCSSESSLSRVCYQIERVVLIRKNIYAGPVLSFCFLFNGISSPVAAGWFRCWPICSSIWLLLLVTFPPMYKQKSMYALFVSNPKIPSNLLASTPEHSYCVSPRSGQLWLSDLFSLNFVLHSFFLIPTVMHFLSICFDFSFGTLYLLTLSLVSMTGEISFSGTYFLRGLVEMCRLTCCLIFAMVKIKL